MLDLHGVNLQASPLGDWSHFIAVASTNLALEQVTLRGIGSDGVLCGKAATREIEEYFAMLWKAEKKLMR